MFDEPWLISNHGSRFMLNHGLNAVMLNHGPIWSMAKHAYIIMVDRKL